MISTDAFLAAAAYRRTIYSLKASTTVSNHRVQDILQQVLSFAPSSYNTQPNRLTLITGEKHKQFWDVVIEAVSPLLKKAGENVFQQMSARLANFKQAQGSVLFWESTAVTEKASQDHASAARFFPMYAEHSSGMAQIMVWTALELEGLGANLQHVGALPEVEAAVKAFVDVPEDYRLKAHLNYGDKGEEHPEKPEKLPFSETLKSLM